MDTLTNEADLAPSRSPAGAPGAARSPADAHLTRPSMPSLDGDVQVEWFERLRPKPPIESPAPLDIDVSFEDDDDPDRDVPTNVFRRTRNIWTSED